MNVTLKIKEDNFKDKQLVPREFDAEIEGTKILKIITEVNKEVIEFNYDLKRIAFSEENLLLEVIIANHEQLIGRCIFSVNEP